MGVIRRHFFISESFRPSQCKFERVDMAEPYRSKGARKFHVKLGSVLSRQFSEGGFWGAQCYSYLICKILGRFEISVCAPMLGRHDGMAPSPTFRP
jgi:hypothetical protein